MFRSSVSNIFGTITIHNNPKTTHRPSWAQTYRGGLFQRWASTEAAGIQSLVPESPLNRSAVACCVADAGDEVRVDRKPFVSSVRRRRSRGKGRE
jgi:hypothetical protein